MRKAVTVTINGKRWVIRQLPPRENQAWCEQFSAKFAPLLSGLAACKTDTLGDGLHFIAEVLTAVINAPEIIHELLTLYHPAFEDSYDSEAMDAFPKILGLAFPRAEERSHFHQIKGRA